MAIVRRSWGCYRVLEYGLGFKTKLLVVNPFSKSKMQKHNLRSEIWTFVSGRRCGETVVIPKKKWHRLENRSNKELIIIETQIGICREEDIERKGE
jgi:mannose-6-phosphate isomerase-like protein (cupin superfamily)